MSGDFPEGHTTSAESIEYAAAEGLDVVLPDNNQLLIDIDDKAGMDEWARNYDIVDLKYGVANVKSTKSRRKRDGYHLVVTLRTPVAPMERILLQAILGSDRRREGHSLLRLLNSDPNPTLFFERKPDGATGEAVSG